MAPIKTTCHSMRRFCACPTVSSSECSRFEFWETATGGGDVTPTATIRTTTMGNGNAAAWPPGVTAGETALHRKRVHEGILRRRLDRSLARPCYAQHAGCRMDDGASVLSACALDRRAK